MYELFSEIFRDVTGTQRVTFEHEFTILDEYKEPNQGATRPSDNVWFANRPTSAWKKCMAHGEEIPHSSVLVAHKLGIPHDCVKKARAKRGHNKQLKHLQFKRVELAHVNLTKRFGHTLMVWNHPR